MIINGLRRKSNNPSSSANILSSRTGGVSSHEEFLTFNEAPAGANYVQYSPHYAYGHN